MKKLLILLLTLLVTVISFSQIPEKMSYQAVVRNSLGSLVKNSPVGIKISIIPESKGITYAETHIATTNNDGLVTLEIGGGTVVLGTFSAINWTEGPYMLMSEVDPVGGTNYTITGTSRILSVPYAFYSKSADYNSLLNKPLLFDGTWTSLSGKPAFSTVATTGSYSDLSNKPTILNSQWTTSGSNIYYNAGNVGIGTVNTTSRVLVQPPSVWDDNVPLFEVKNKTGVPIFAVYNNGVRILVDHSDTKSVKGGFAVGGYDMTKAGKTVDFMTISPDSIRFNINNQNTKGAKGGFAVGGFDASKGSINQDFMYITPQFSSNGQYNTFLGYQAGHNNQSTGLYNSFIGYNSGYSNTIGGYNVFLGHQAGSNSTNTHYNTFLGYQAGQNAIAITDLASEGSSNVFIGDQAGKNVTTGCRSIIIGMVAGYNWTGGGLSSQSNLFIGYNAGSGLGVSGSVVGSVVGNFNTYIGTEAAARMQSGDLNVFIGDRAGVEARKGQHNVLIGGLVNYYSWVPVSRTDSINDNVYLGFGTGGHNWDGDRNVMIGSTSGAESKGSGNIFIGYKAGMNETGSNKLYIDNSNISTPLIYGDFTNGSEKLVFNGNVGIGTTPGYKLQVGNAGDGSQARANAWNLLSDIRLKTDFANIIDPIEKINSLSGFYFNWNIGTDKSRQLGLSAQDVEMVFPEIVSEGNDGYLSVEYSKLTPVLIEAIKEQQMQIESTKLENQQLKSELQVLKDKMERIEAMLAQGGTK